MSLLSLLGQSGHFYYTYQDYPVCFFLKEEENQMAITMKQMSVLIEF